MPTDDVTLGALAARIEELERSFAERISALEVALARKEELLQSQQLKVEGSAHIEDRLIVVGDIWYGGRFRALPLIWHGASINFAEYSPDGNMIVTVSDDNTVRLWDAVECKELRQLMGHAGAVNSAAFSPDGKTLVTGGADKEVRVWDVLMGYGLYQLLGHTDTINSVTFSPDGKTFLSAGGDRTLREWDAASGRQLRVIHHIARFTSVTYSPDGKTIIAATNGPYRGIDADPEIWAWDAATGTDRGWILEANVMEIFHSIAYSPSGDTIVTAGRDGTAQVWDAATGSRLVQLKGHMGPVMYAAYSPDSKTIVTAGVDKTGLVWDTATGQQICALIGHNDAVNSAVYSPDGKTIVTASSDKTVRLWDAATGREIR